MNITYKKLFNKIWQIYKSLRLYLFCVFLISSFLAGYYFIAPFFETEAYKWLSMQIDKSVLISELVDVDGVIVNALIAVTVPLFVVYAGVFFAYDVLNGNTELLNKSTVYFSIFTGGPGKLLLILFSGILGISVYIFREGSVSEAIYLAVLAGLVFLIPGVFFLYHAHPKFEKSIFLDKYALLLATIFGTLAIFGYFYGVLASPVRIWFAMQNSFGNL